jgi:predicted component of type VI protein secretion system
MRKYATRLRRAVQSIERSFISRFLVGKQSKVKLLVNNAELGGINVKRCFSQPGSIEISAE